MPADQGLERRLVATDEEALEQLPVAWIRSVGHGCLSADMADE
jgi:hypothetical protein